MKPSKIIFSASILGLLLLSACYTPVVYFEQVQPVNGEDLLVFPKSFEGQFLFQKYEADHGPYFTSLDATWPEKSEHDVIATLRLNEDRTVLEMAFDYAISCENNRHEELCNEIDSLLLDSTLTILSQREDGMTVMDADSHVFSLLDIPFNGYFTHHESETPFSGELRKYVYDLKAGTRTTFSDGEEESDSSESDVLVEPFQLKYDPRTETYFLNHKDKEKGEFWLAEGYHFLTDGNIQRFTPAAADTLSLLQVKAWFLDQSIPFETYIKYDQNKHSIAPQADSDWVRVDSLSDQDSEVTYLLDADGEEFQRVLQEPLVYSSYVWTRIPDASSTSWEDWLSYVGLFVFLLSIGWVLWLRRNRLE